ncbi:hypothetical protein V5O48_017051, partial [Marasmius crinis-equi]
MLVARPGAGEVFKPSVEDLRRGESIILPFGYLSIALCIAALLIIALLAIHPVSRPVVDRVSFRMLIYLIVGTFVFNVAALSSSGMPNYRTCPIAGPLLEFALHSSSFLSFCIGLNLQLVTIHGVDGQKAEKFYVGGSFGLATALGIMCFASNQWTYHPEIGDCWPYDPDPVKQLLWQ